jgi:transposase
MRTEAHRRIYRREGDGYPSDLLDAEWARLLPLIPEASPGGRPAQDRHAGDERHFVFAAHRLPLALSAARRLSARAPLGKQPPAQRRQGWSEKAAEC